MEQCQPCLIGKDDYIFNTRDENDRIRRDTSLTMKIFVKDNDTLTVISENTVEDQSHQVDQRELSIPPIDIEEIEDQRLAILNDFELRQELLIGVLTL